MLVSTAADLLFCSVPFCIHSYRLFMLQALLCLFSRFVLICNERFVVPLSVVVVKYAGYHFNGNVLSSSIIAVAFIASLLLLSGILFQVHKDCRKKMYFSSLYRLTSYFG